MPEPENSRPPRDDIRAVNPDAFGRVFVREAEDGDDQPPTLYGHFARFNEWTEIDSIFEGNFMERVAPGAFKKTFREQRDQMRVLLQHGKDPMLGLKPIAEPQVVREDDEGAYYEARLFDGLPQLVMDGLRAGQYGSSFRFGVLREEWIEKPRASDYNPKGLPERTLKELRVPEFGPVAWGAYPGATASVRSLTDEFVFSWIAAYPARARELLGATDLSRAAFRAADHPSGCDCGEIACPNYRNTPQDAPSDTDAALTRTSAQERRDTDRSSVLTERTEHRSVLRV